MTFSRAVVSARIDDGRKLGELEESLLPARAAARRGTCRKAREGAQEVVEKRAAREARGRERDRGRKDTILKYVCLPGMSRECQSKRHEGFGSVGVGEEERSRVSTAVWEVRWEAFPL